MKNTEKSKENTKIAFETKRLKFQLLSKEDITYLENLENDTEVRHFFSTGAHKSRQQTEEMIDRFTSYYNEYGLPSFLIFEIHTNEFIGRCGFGLLEETGEIEVGYVLHKKYWGKGYASEALSALIHWAKDNINTDYIVAYAPKEHLASQRVMEKCAMQYYKIDTDKTDNVECRFYRIKIK